MKLNNYYIFRVDANSRIGFGHLTRCLALAKEINNQGGKIVFASCYPKVVRKIVNNLNFDIINLKNCTPFSMQELDFLVSSLNKMKFPKAFIVDSYEVSPEYLKEIRKEFPEILIIAIDDLGGKVYPVNILINGNLYAEKLDYVEQKKLGTKLLLGPQFLILREEFQKCLPRKIRNQVEDILITFGGSNDAGLIERVLQILANMNLAKVKFHLVSGCGFSKRVKEEFMNYLNVIFYSTLSGREMRDLMKKADLAISAGGSTLYELAKCGVPTIAIPIADNQIMLTEEMEKCGIIDIVKFDDNFPINLSEKILLHLSSKEKRVKMQENALEKINVCDTGLIVEEIFKQKVQIEPYEAGKAESQGEEELNV